MTGISKIYPAGMILLLIISILATGTYAAAFSISIQPIQVCSNGECADPLKQLFVSETQKIWDQAGLGINFLPWNSFAATDNIYYDLDIESEFISLISQPGHGQNPSALVIDMWFVNSLNNRPTVFGVSALDYGYIAISDSIFDWNLGKGRIDTIAHEIGHALNLDHYTGANTSLNLMASGNVRLVPVTINDIYPDGNDYDQLTLDQITMVLNSRYVTDETVPEPATLLLLGVGIGFMALSRKSLKARP